MSENSIAWSKSTLFRLFSSSAVSILLVSVGTLLVTRIYTPSQFGQYSFILSLAILIAPLLTATYEFFIVPSQTEEESLRIYRNGFYRTIKNSVLLLVVTAFIYLTFPKDILSLDSHISQIILAIILASIYGVYNLLTQIALRRLDYTTVSRRALIQNGTIYSSQLLLGNSLLKGSGLIVGEFIGRVITVTFIARRLKMKTFFILQKPKNATSIFRSQVITNTTATIFEIITASSLFFYIYSTQNVDSSGNFALAQKLLTVPIILFGTTTAQYLFASGSASMRQGIHMSRSELDRILLKLFLMSISIGTGMYLFGSLAIDLVLNSNWESVGALITIMSPYLIISLIWTQLSYSFYTKDLWKPFFCFATLRFIVTIAVILLCYLNEFEMSHTIHLALGTNSIVSIAAIGYLRKNCNNNRNEV